MKILLKQIYVSILLLLCNIGQVNAQTVYPSPEYPTTDKQVTIYYDASKGNQALLNFNGEIYAHTGVITNLSTSTNDWKYVKTEWSENTSENILTKISSNLYKLTLSPTITEYYNAPTTEIINKLAFVFRNNDGTIVGRDTDGSDFFVQVYSNNNEITIKSPDSTKIYSKNDSISISAVALGAKHFELYINDTLATSVDSENLSFTYVANKEGNNKIQFTATNTSDSTYSKTIHVFIRSNSTIADLPYQNLKDGINYIDSTTVTLVLYAPYKNYVMVKGDFSNWEYNAQFQLAKTPDSLRYWVTISNLTPKKEYAFQYVIDGTITIADPYTEKILDPWNDSYINSTTYPNLKPYPIKKTTGIVSVFSTNQDNYQWVTTNFTPPAKDNLIIYECLVRDFIISHNYQTLTDSIHYLKTLGINAIELMPINEFEGNNSWGYNPSFYFAPDKYYGTKNDLKHFIDKCHENGIAVIIDMVLNHSYGQSPLVQMYFDASAGDYGQPTSKNPWYNTKSPNSSYSWGYDFNHESSATKKFVSRVTKFWIKKYKVDGYRFDFTKGFTNKPGDGWAYDQSRINILLSIADSIWSVNDKAYIILEHLTENSEEKALSDYGLMLWGNINNEFCQASMGYSSQSDFSWMSYKNRNWNKPNLIGYMESHDEERQMYKDITWGNSSITYNIKDTLTALTRVELTSTFFLTVPGPKMLWQFEELGYDYSINYDCRVCDKPIVWDYLDNKNREHLKTHIQSILELRKSLSLFSTNDFEMNVSSSIKTIELHSDTLEALIIGNFDIKPQNTTITSSSNNWYDYFSNASYTNDTLLQLQPGELQVLFSRKIPFTPTPDYPKATNVRINGNKYIGDTLYGKYSYSDINNDEEANSTYNWYRATDSLGTNKTKIDNANSRFYICKNDDYNKFITFTVNPVSNSSILSIGQIAESLPYGKISYKANKPIIYPNPTSSEVTVENIQNYTLIKLININGEVLLTKSITSTSLINIDLSTFATGIYIIRVINNKNSDNYKIIKN